MKNFIKLRNRLVVIPFSLPWDWSADYERQTALTLSQKGFKVIVYLHKDAHFFLKSDKTIYREIKNVIFFKPLYLIPFKRFAFIEKINQLINLKYLIYKYGKRKKVILWIFSPVFSYFRKFATKKTIILYDCVDYCGSLDSGKDKILKEKEIDLINKSSYFFVNSHILKKLHGNKSKKPYLVPQGFSLDVFKNPKRTKVLLKKTKPLIGFIGSIDYRLDFELLFKIIKNNPNLNFVFWGPINISGREEIYKKIQKYVDKLLSFKNVTYGKSDNRREIPDIIKQFDICIIPYDVSIKFNKFCYPTKLLEYFYLGKPVISTPIEELKLFKKYIKIADTVSDWTNFINLKQFKLLPRRYQIERRRFAEENSWDRKISVIMQKCNLINK